MLIDAQVGEVVCIDIIPHSESRSRVRTPSRARKT